MSDPEDKVRLDLAAIIAADTGRRLGDRSEGERRHLFLLAEKVINIAKREDAIRQATASALREEADSVQEELCYGESDPSVCDVCQVVDHIRKRADHLAPGGDH